MSELAARRLVSEWDRECRATLNGLRQLHYARGAEHVAHDLPPYVRAVSALRRWQGKSVLVQDDVNALVVGDADFDQLAAVLLPPGPEQRRRFEAELGNKASKLDLEAAAVLPDGRFLALGSGSTAARERIVVMDPSLQVRVIDAHALYAGLRAESAFAGSELNLEGALVVGNTLRLLQRGNGAVRGELRPINAFGDFDLGAFLAWLDDGKAPPPLRDVTQIELGHHGEAALSLTDAALLFSPEPGTPLEEAEKAAWVVTACAEASPNTYDDGVVTASCVGVVHAGRLAMVPVVDNDGLVLPVKIEGIEPVPGQPGDFHVVIDADDAARPALIGTLSVRHWSG